MNTWQSWNGLHVAGIVLHSVPPALVFLAAETAPVLRDRLTEAVNRAALSVAAPGSAGAAPRNSQPEPMPEADPAPALAAPEKAAPPRPVARRKPASRKLARRKLLADYVAEARAAWVPGTEITPAWVRSVTDCARGTSKAVADTLRSELTEHGPALTAVTTDEERGEAA
jgi:hypothetical protein